MVTVIRNMDLGDTVCPAKCWTKNLSTVTKQVTHSAHTHHRETESIRPEEEIDQQTGKAVSFAARETQLSHVQELHRKVHLFIPKSLFPCPGLTFFHFPLKMCRSQRRQLKFRDPPSVKIKATNLNNCEVTGFYSRFLIDKRIWKAETWKQFCS